MPETHTCGVKSFREYRQKLQAHAERAIAYLSDSNRSERERAVCRAFLRWLGVPFSESEIIAPAREPADVSFREAMFQVREIVERGSRRHQEWKSRLSRAIRARSMGDVTVPWNSPDPMSLSELTVMVADALEVKARKYGKTQCLALDAMVYADLTRTRFFLPNEEHGGISSLQEQGWRSVSVLFPPYGIVLSATSDAPSFLKTFVGTAHNHWSDLNGLFDATRPVTTGVGPHTRGDT